MPDNQKVVILPAEPKTSAAEKNEHIAQQSEKPVRQQAAEDYQQTEKVERIGIPLAEISVPR